MSGAQIFALAIAAIAVLAAIAIFAVAFRSDSSTRTGSIKRSDLVADRRRSKDQAKVKQAEAEVEVEVEPQRSAIAVAEPDPVPDPLEERPALSEAEMGVTRRSFFTRGVLAAFGIFLLQFALGSLAFIWPKLKAGAFGSPIDAGDIDEIKALLSNPDGTVTPFFVPAAQSYVLPFRAVEDDSDFAGTGVIVDDVMALWQRCVHLGCRVPFCEASQGFECPCHGSKYNSHGEYQAGPAPRNLDRFVITVNDSNRLIIDTGAVIQTARSRVKTIEYPQGPSCLSA